MLRFRLGRIPVRVHLMFGITALILWQLSGQQSAETLGIWVGVMFLGVLMHELGHAWAGMMCGLKPNIDLHGMGGVTWWSGGRALSPWRSIVVSVAGPLVGIVLGGLALIYTIIEAPLPAGSLKTYALGSFIWVNLGWGLFNLVPMLPLDGGNILASICEIFSPRSGRRVASYLSLVMAAVLIGVCVLYGQLIMAGFFAYFAWGIFRSLKGEKERALDAPLEPKLKKAVQAMQDGDFGQTVALARMIAGDAKTPSMKAAATQLIAWAHFVQGDLDGAQKAIDDRPPGAPLDEGLQGAILLGKGEPELALRYLEGAMHSSPDPKIPELLCVALLRADRGHEVIALLESGAAKKMPEGALGRLAAVAEDVGESELARKISSRVRGQ